MTIITSFALRYIGEPATARDPSLKLISLVVCLGLAVSLGMIAFGFDMNVV